MAVETVDIVVSALTAGAAAGVKDSAATAVKDAYAGLLTLLRRRLGHARTDELTALAEAHIDDPQAGHDQLTAALTPIDVALDADVVAAAQILLAQLDPAATPTGKYQVDARDAQGVQIGDGNTMTVHFRTS
jgi:hypothetical protein